MHYINDPKTQPDAVKIMAARVGLTPEDYKPLLKGTHLLDVAEGKKIVQEGPTASTRSTARRKIADDFNVANARLQGARRTSTATSIRR